MLHLVSNNDYTWQQRYRAALLVRTYVSNTIKQYQLFNVTLFSVKTPATYPLLCLFCLCALVPYALRSDAVAGGAGREGVNTLSALYQ